MTLVDGFSARTGGNDPLETAQTPPVQLVQINWFEYGTLTVPFGSGDVEVMVCASAIAPGTSARMSVRSVLMAGLPSQQGPEARSGPRPRRRRRVSVRI